MLSLKNSENAEAIFINPFEIAAISQLAESELSGRKIARRTRVDIKQGHSFMVFEEATLVEALQRSAMIELKAAEPQE